MFIYIVDYYYYFIIMSLLYVNTIKDRDQFLSFCETLVSSVLDTYRHSIKFYMTAKIKYSMIEIKLSKMLKFQKEV